MKKSEVMADTDVTWDITHEVSICVCWEERAVANTLSLFDQDNTIPFIARYRQSATKGMDPDKLREVKQKYEELKTVKEKVVKLLTNPQHKEKMTAKLERALKSAKTLTEVEHLSAPFKSGSKRSLAERAKELGLEGLANDVIAGSGRSLKEDILAAAVVTSKKGMSSREEVSSGVQHIIADRMSKDEETLARVRKLSGHERGRFGDISIEVSEAKKPATAKNGANNEAKKTTVDVTKFADYLDKKFNINYIRPHQVLAINRGENVKALSVKFTLAEREREAFQGRLRSLWLKHYHRGKLEELMTHSIQDGFKRLIEPLILRQARSELNKRAEQASIDVFAANLKRLLLTPPVKGKVVLGVDPGFHHGCKYAVTSSTGCVLDTGVAYLHKTKASDQKEAEKIKEVILKNKCETVAIGNGTACRETEAFFSDCIAGGLFKPLNVQYCIVDESGASVYSASAEAKRELPGYDVTIRGAVSIARRLQDPLAELVKIEPKHIGVGMYQHDCHEARLKQSLDEVVMECVSFTGIDLNTSSEVLLRKIAGLNPKLSERIVKYREEHGGFTNREELKTIQGVGPITFQQCAGFVRILPNSLGDTSKMNSTECSDTALKSGSKRKAPKSKKSSAKKQKLEASFSRNPLDMTSIHPETYYIADRFIEDMKLNKEDIGSKHFIDKVQCCAPPEKLAEKYSTEEQTMSFIMKSLTQPVEWDFRETFEKPLFRKEVVSIASLNAGTRLTGKVQNVVPFGCFVDVGVGVSGLLHRSCIQPQLLKGGQQLGIGDTVEVEVRSVDVSGSKKRISLALVKVL